jgi:hypothetical protein
MTADQVRTIKGYEEWRRNLLGEPGSTPIAVGLDDWVIRAAVLNDDLTREQRDHLAERLHATLRRFFSPQYPYKNLEGPLGATELLSVIGLPVDPGQYRKDIHALLKRLHHEAGGGFQRAGGFQSFENIHSGDLHATSVAIQLMEVYGIPKDLNLDWDRSFLRPAFTQFGVQQWLPAVTLARLNRLPGVTHPSWLEVLYYERSFVAAVVLIVLCIYATAISPKPPRVLSKESD